MFRFGKPALTITDDARPMSQNLRKRLNGEAEAEFKYKAAKIKITLNFTCHF